MKRFMFFLMIGLYLALISMSCRPGKKQAGEQAPEHDGATHVHGDETHTHAPDSIHVDQESFIVTDSLSTTDSAAKVHEHAHEHGTEHKH